MMSFMNPYRKQVNSKFKTASRMNEYPISSKLHATMIFYSKNLKLPASDLNTEPQSYYSKSVPMSRTCSINITQETV